MGGFGLLLIAFVVYMVYLFNALVALKVKCNEAWSDITVQLKRRYDLIPNLINMVKGYKEYEGGVMEKITKYRTEAINAGNTPNTAKAEAENMLTGALKSVFAVAENYPDLKANPSFINLQEELADTEDKISSARRFYNANVTEFNTMLEQFPSNIVASIFNFEKREFFESTEEGIITPPKVEL